MTDPSRTAPAEVGTRAGLSGALACAAEASIAFGPPVGRDGEVAGVRGRVPGGRSPAPRGGLSPSARRSAATGRSRVSTHALGSPEPVTVRALRYLDLILLALVLPVFLLAGLPMIGYAVGAAAWI